MQKDDYSGTKMSYNSIEYKQMMLKVLKYLTTQSNKGGDDSGTKVSYNSIGFKKMMMRALVYLYP